MSNKTKFFNDAIAEAKVIKETALSNAKLAMAESFAPQIKSMLSSQLNEMEEDLEENVGEEEMSLDELLNSLEEGDDYGTNMVTGKPLPKPDPIVENDDELPEFEGEEIEVDEFNPELSDEGGELLGDEEVGEITVDQLKELIRSVNQELASEETFEDEMPEEETEEIPEEELGIDDDEEIDLNEILGEMSDTSMDGSNAAGDGLENVISQVKSLVSKSPEYLAKISEFIKGLPAGAGSALRSETIELAESKKTVARLIKEKRDLNLLNSKLLYVNKLFKANNLTEGVKIKVVNALDRATTPKESENIFLALKESLGKSVPQKPLHENKGRASKPAGLSQRPNTQILTEDVDFVARMQKLAGIKL